MKRALSRKNVWEQLPPWLKTLLAKLCGFIPLHYLIGARFRSESLLIHQADKWSKQEIDHYHLQKLKHQLRNAYLKCPAYKTLFDEAHVDVFAFDCLDDFKKIPFIDKSFINNNIEQLCMLDPNGVGIDYVTTGGTSGIPLKFYINASRSQIEYAYLNAAWARAGFTLGDIKVVIRGKVTEFKDGMHYSYDPIFKEYYYSSFNMSEQDMRNYCLHIKTLASCFLHVYPSSIYQLARFAKKENIRFENVRGILAESENVYPTQREFVESIFNCRYYSSYGHSEKLIAAGECESSHYYHVWPTYGYLELIDDCGNIIDQKGQVGEIVSTGYINTIMPFIRYRTGDYAEFAGHYCPQCHRHHLILKNIRGHRIQEYLVAKDNSLISWTAINMHDDTFDDVLQYQFYQDTPGFAIIKVRVSAFYNAEKQQRMLENIERKLTDRVTLSVLVVDHITQTAQGKSIFVDQHIPLPQSRSTH